MRKFVDGYDDINETTDLESESVSDFRESESLTGKSRFSSGCALLGRRRPTPLQYCLGLALACVVLYLASNTAAPTVNESSVAMAKVQTETEAQTMQLKKKKEHKKKHKKKDEKKAKSQATSVPMPIDKDEEAQKIAAAQQEINKNNSWQNSDEAPEAPAPYDGEPDSPGGPSTYPTATAAVDVGAIDADGHPDTWKIQSNATNSTWCFNCPARCDNVIAAILDRNPVNTSQVKMASMAEGIFPFYRATDHLYLEDVLTWPHDSPFFAFSKFMTSLTWIDADQHLDNFGSFHDSISTLVYDMNDFDEVMIGPYAIDLWRTAISILIQANENNMTDTDAEYILRSFAYTYFSTVIGYVDNHNELYFELGLNNTYGPVHALMKEVKATKTRVKMLDKWAPKTVDGLREFKFGKKGLVEAEPETVEKLYDAWPFYIVSCGVFQREGEPSPFDVVKDVTGYYKIKSVALRTGAGLGSLGVERYYVLIEGRTKSEDDDIILDVKFEPEPSWKDFASSELLKMNQFKDHGERVVVGFKALKTKVPPTLGYLKMKGKVFVVRPRSPYKGNVDYTTLTNKEEFREVTDQLAKITATNHARADNDYRPDIIPWSFEDEFAKTVVDTGSGPFIDSVVDFAFMWHEQLKKDFDCFAASNLVPSA